MMMYRTFVHISTFCPLGTFEPEPSSPPSLLFTGRVRLPLPLRHLRRGERGQGGGGRRAEEEGAPNRGRVERARFVYTGMRLFETP